MNYTGRVKKKKFGQSFIKNKMSRTRFYDIKTCFYAYDRKEFDEKLENLQNTLAENMIRVWNNKFQNFNYPEANISLDEGLCPWK